MQSCCSIFSSDMSPKSSQKDSKKKSKKVTNEQVERELDHMAKCFEVKRLERLAKYPLEQKACIKAQRCCTPHPTNADVFFNRFVKEMEEDHKILKKIKTQSACRVMKVFNNNFPPLVPQKSCCCPEAPTVVICSAPPRSVRGCPGGN